MVSEELKPCALCGSELIVGESSDNRAWEAYCTNHNDCGLVINRGDDNALVLIRDLNNLPRLTEQKKAEIALEKIREFLEIESEKMIGSPEEKLYIFLLKKAKGER